MQMEGIEVVEDKMKLGDMSVEEGMKMGDREMMDGNRKDREMKQ